MKGVTRLASSILLFLLAACAGSSDEPPPTPTLEERCGSLRDHLVAMRLDGVDVDRAQHERAHRQALGDGFVAECAAAHDDDALTCALAAKDSAAVSVCLVKEVTP